MPPALEITTSKFVEASLNIATPKGGVVGSNFRVHGMAAVLMRLTEFIKVGGQGTKTVEEFFVSQGFKMTITVNGATSELVPEVLSNHTLAWAHDVKDGAPGQKFKIGVKLNGSVVEEEVKLIDGEKASGSSKPIKVARSAEVSVQVDSDPPDLRVTAIEVSEGPPYEAAIKGTAQDAGTNVQSVHARVDGGSEVLAQSLSGQFASWEFKVFLPDRINHHTVGITAADGLGNTSDADVSIEPDQAPPVAAISKPTNPHFPTFEEGGIVVSVEGLAFDDDSRDRRCSVAAGRRLSKERTRPRQELLQVGIGSRDRDP